MSEEIKPIKRSPELAPLSRQHHEGLLFAWKLRQGIKYNVVSERMAAFVQWFWPLHLVPHFKKEEELLPPVLGVTAPLIQQMFAEHDTIRGMIEAVTDTTSYPQFELLADNITAHIRFEERTLFNEVEKAASTEQLELIDTNLQDEKTDHVWEDEFWVAPK